MGLAALSETANRTTVTVYCVQSFWRDRRKLAAGRLRQFKNEADARMAGESASRRDAGVIVFAITGNPEADYWDEPRLLASYGDVPDLAV